MRVVLLVALVAAQAPARAQSWWTPYGTSRQVNVNAAGQNIPGDAANEPSLCIDPTNPNRIAVGWRQFDRVTNSFRQAGWAYSTNGGTTWVFPGTIDTNVFRSDPVLAADADGRFYYLGVLTNGVAGVNYHCNLWRSTNGGVSWEPLGNVYGGDKEWLAIDTTSGPGRGNLYQSWSPWYNYAGNPSDPDRIFSRSTDGGVTWSPPITMPHWPYWGTLDIGPDGTLYSVGTDGYTFWMNRSTNAPNRKATVAFDLTREVNLGGTMIYGSPDVNPDGLLGQPWIAVDRSSQPTRGNVYVLCTVTGVSQDPADVVFARSTDGGETWSAPLRLNDDPPYRNAWHWFGTLSVAPNGRIDACWNDTRHDPNNTFSELYYAFSEDGGLTWSPNYPVSPAFNHRLGYPVQRKMGDYIGMISLADAACIAYAATFNGEEDVYFLRVQPPITVNVTRSGETLHLVWNARAGATYCVQTNDRLDAPWDGSANVGCRTAQGNVATFDLPIATGAGQRFYRVVRQP
jgi:hypothetical protein